MAIPRGHHESPRLDKLSAPRSDQGFASVPHAEAPIPHSRSSLVISWLAVGVAGAKRAWVTILDVAKRAAIKIGKGCKWIGKVSKRLIVRVTPTAKNLAKVLEIISTVITAFTALMGVAFGWVPGTSGPAPSGRGLVHPMNNKGANTAKTAASLRPEARTPIFQTPDQTPGTPASGYSPGRAWLPISQADMREAERVASRVVDLAAWYAGVSNCGPNVKDYCIQWMLAGNMTPEQASQILAAYSLESDSRTVMKKDARARLEELAHIIQAACPR